MTYPDHARTLIALRDADIALHARTSKELDPQNWYPEEMAAVHDHNATVLGVIIDEIGYPTADKVGWPGNSTAWLVLQHAIGKPDLMRRCARLMEEAVAEGKEYPQHLAYLKDRIAVLENRPQRYGLLFDWDANGELSPEPCDDLASVNERRKGLGLNSLEEQTREMRSQAAEEGRRPPTDPTAIRQAMEGWKRRVGWIRPIHPPQSTSSR
ncbi:DUF6624 domain-containing protein [Lewinella sp. IMCC34191]|uniref:DUF6624 domain-containing protein n=1 Tax=Lewinella sp. IMCC34191 TaxID=2259172 RepID=UPI000E23E18F|nr:DUF6624 domain-containing protein [Lewinella sp. IMCC34191]